MKRFNKNIIVFVAAFLFIALGFSVKYLTAFKYELYVFLTEDLKQGDPDCVLNFFRTIDETSSEYLRYHDELMDLNSVKQVVLNNRIVPKGNMEVVKTDSGSLISPQTQSFPQEDLEDVVEKIGALQQFSGEHGAEFLYVGAPRKTLAIPVPENVVDYETDNYRRLMSELERSNIPSLDLVSVMEQEGTLTQDAFFITDHHWKPETGLWAAGEICRELGSRYGFAYDESLCHIGNYDVTVYEDWFLGSHGKKVGRYFVEESPEDFSLITPRFETSLSEERPLKNEGRTGTFEETLLFKENLNEKDHYLHNPYATYSGGNFRLQTVKNHLNPEGAKVLVIIDSYANVVTPFLALNTAELHIIDTRNFIPAEKISVYDYIEKMQPDYVMMLYSGNQDMPDGQGRYDFE